MDNRLDVPNPPRKRSHAVCTTSLPPRSPPSSGESKSSNDGTQATNDGATATSSAPSAWEIVRKSIDWLSPHEFETMWRGRSPPPDWLTTLPTIVSLRDRKEESLLQNSVEGKLSVEDRQKVEQKRADKFLALNVAIMRLNPVTLSWLSDEKEIQIKALLSKDDPEETKAFRKVLTASLALGPGGEVFDKTRDFDRILDSAKRGS